jgi:serine/threonine protein kinase
MKRGDREIPQVLLKHFEVKRKLGSGSFGDVLEATDTRTGAKVAIKIEPRNALHPQLEYERRVMEELKDIPGFPRIISFTWDRTHNMLIMERLNCSLEQLRERERGSLPLSYLLPIGIEALNRLDVFHTQGLAHRDIKPENFMISKDVLYLIDFGLCKRVTDPETNQHIARRTDKTLAGTPRYASLRSHAGIEQSRRDDVESLVYMFVFLAKGSLPWQGRTDHVATIKSNTEMEVLCRDLPQCFLKTLQYARNLEFEEMPDYDTVRSWWKADCDTMETAMYK